jgi:hypothetical protein
MARRRQDERVAVGRRLGHEGSADGVAGAGTVLDDHAAAELRSELGVDRAGEDVLHPARGERHHDPRYAALALCRDRSTAQGGCNQEPRQLLLPLAAAGLAFSCGQ